MITTIIIFLLVLSLLVFVHELGHFVSARKLGVRSEEFGFGFPPRVFGLYKSDNGKWKKVWGNKKVEDNVDTIYSINAIPLGGFVKIKGQDGDEKQASDSFASKKSWKRGVILSSGVIMNIVLAAVLISIGLMIGFPQAIDKNNLPKSIKVSDEKIQVTQVLKDYPADLAGIKASDVILSINENEIKSEEDVQKYIAETEGEVILKISRNNEVQDLNIIPKTEEGGKKIIGIGFSQTAVIKYPWYQAIWEGIKMTGYLLWAIIFSLYELIRNLIVGQSASVDVAGPIGIADLTGQMARMGLIYLIQFTALLSLNLAVINILPFPALDGGRLLFLLIEKIKGKPVKQTVEAIFHNLGFILLMALVAWVTLKDIIKLFN